MPRPTQLDAHWNMLMSLCAKERELQLDKRHPRLLRLVSDQIDQLARDMGFSPNKIPTRDFRARKDGERIVWIDKS
jgi:hypothetical protein